MIRIYKFRTASFILGLILLTACDIFEYSPNQIVLDDDEKNLNHKNITLLQSKPAKDTIKFILMGDTQRFYEEADDFVKSANKHPDLDFVIHAGDISDFGLSQEYIWVNDIMSKLKVPYFTVIGNHDLIANGVKVYKKMFGPLNFSFTYSGIKFIFYDGNSREYGFDGTVPDLNWIGRELADTDSYDWAIPVAHIPPDNVDTDLTKEEDFINLLTASGKVNLSLHGHEHSFTIEEKYDNGITFVVATTVQKKGYAFITLYEGDFTVEKIYY